MFDKAVLHTPIVINLITAVAVFLVLYLLIAFIFGLNLMELKFFGLLCRKMPRNLSLLSRHHAVSSIITCSPYCCW